MSNTCADYFTKHELKKTASTHRESNEQALLLVVKKYKEHSAKGAIHTTTVLSECGVLALFWPRRDKQRTPRKTHKSKPKIRP